MQVSRYLLSLSLLQPTKWQRADFKPVSNLGFGRGGWRKLHKLGRFDKAVRPVTTDETTATALKGCTFLPGGPDEK